MALLLGIDKGTSVIKSVVFDEDGRARGKGEQRVAVLSPSPGWHEEDPEQTWRACCLTVRAALDAAGASADGISGVGIAAHMGGAWIVDEAGRALRNAICWPDERAQPILSNLEADGVLDKAFAISGNGLMPGITLMVLAWLSRHEPDIAQRAHAVLGAKDYLRLRLTGAFATDPSDVSFVPGNIGKRTHSNELMEMIGASDWAHAMPPIQPSGSVAGHVTSQAAADTGLKEGTPVVTGLGDAVANVIGAGRSKPGEAITVLGTSCLNSQIMSGPNSAPDGLGFLFAMPDENYVRILPNTSGTITMDWFLNNFGGPKNTDGSWDFGQMEARVSALPIGAGGVLMLPYVNTAGVLAPFYDPRARGTFFGMSSQTSRDHLLRAVYEAIAYSTRDCLSAMPGERQVLTLTGGGARSGFWAQMFADVCGLPVEICSSDQTGALGVAILAGVAAGVWPDVTSAQAQSVSIAARFQPNPATSTHYDDWFGLYRQTRDVYRAYSDARSQLIGGAP